MMQTIDIWNLGYVVQQNSKFKNLRSATLGHKYIRVIKSEFVAKTQGYKLRNLKRNCKLEISKSTVLKGL